MLCFQRLGKLLKISQDVNKIISEFHEYTIQLACNIMGNKLGLQS